MANRWHCSRHNRDYDIVCPECREEERQEDQDSLMEVLREISENRSEDSGIDISELQSSVNSLTHRIDDLTYQQANPGDYVCPECKFITLRLDASRCPKCHATISSEHWPPIHARIRAAAEAAEKRRQESAEAARILAQQQTKRVEDQKNKETEENAVAFAFLAVLLILSAIGFGIYQMFPHQEASASDRSQPPQEIAPRGPAFYEPDWEAPEGSSKLVSVMPIKMDPVIARTPKIESWEPLSLKIKSIRLTLGATFLTLWAAPASFWTPPHNHIDPSYLVYSSLKDKSNGDLPYLMDESGNIFKFLHEDIGYYNRVDKLGLVHVIDPSTAEEIKMEFQPGLSPEARELKMYHKQFGTFSIPLPQS